MFNIADIVVVAIIGLAGFIGYKRGFVKTGFGFLSFFIAVALTFMFYKPVMEIIKENTEFENWLTEYLYSLDAKQLNNSFETASTGQVTTNENTYISNLPDTVIELIGLNEVKENAKYVIIQKIVDFAVKLLAIVVVYISARLILLIAIIVLDLIAKLPGLKQFNEILGLALGVVLGLLRIYGLFTVITFLGSISATNGLVNTINSSLIASFLYNNNLLLKLLF